MVLEKIFGKSKKQKQQEAQIAKEREDAERQRERMRQQSFVPSPPNSLSFWPPITV